MAIDALVAPLLRVRLFQGLTPLQLSEIARRAERMMYRPGDFLSVAGQPADAAILIVSGASERIVEAVPAQAEPVEPGSLIGEMAMFVDHVYGSTVRATGPVKALRLTRAAMHDHMLADQAMTDHLVSKVAGRLNSVANDLRQIDAMLAKPFQPSATPTPRAVLTRDRAAVDADYYAANVIAAEVERLRIH
jgi:CRP-like cAMP-binding protein